jgi:hypothetical protein
MNPVAEKYAKWRKEQKIVVADIYFSDRWDKEPVVTRWTIKGKAWRMSERKAKR